IKDQVDIIASGGIRNPLDITKAIALGAKTVGIAGAILDKLIADGEDATIEMIQEWQTGLITIMTMLGCTNLQQLGHEKLLLSPKLMSYIKQRKIEY
ncbi:alpha-hydroxy-acid oxidizing protein, partial [Lactobacillaceae bacterium Scapto_B20]